MATLFAGASYGQITLTGGAALQGALNLRGEGTTEIVSTLTFTINNAGAPVTGTVNVTYSAPVTSLAIQGGLPGSVQAAINMPGLPFGPINGTIGGGGQTVSFNLGTFQIPNGATLATVYGVRVNASAVAAGSGLVPVTATPSVTSNSSSSVLPAINVPTVGFVFPSLATPGVAGVASATNAAPSGFPPTPPTNYNTAQGNPAKPGMAPSFYVSVGDSTAGAFKTWGGTGAPTVNVAGTGAGGNYATENPDGFGSYGTRVQLAFGNVPAGVTLYVPTSVSVVQPVGASITSAFTMVLVSSPTAADTGAAGTPPTLPIPTAPPSFSAPNASNLNFGPGAPVFGTVTTTTYAGSAFSSGTYPLTPAGGSAVAVYEVIAAPATSKVSAQIPVYVTFAPAAVSTASGAITVLESYAPSGAVAAATTDPDFAAVTTGALNGSSITIAQTELLFPFVTSNAGFDTGIALSNTTTDPFGSSPATGSCNLNFYGSGAPTPNTNVAAPGGSQASGTSNAFLLSSVAPNFAGYMIAVCNYPEGHGFGYIIYNFGQNSGATMGYLATVMARGPAFTVPAVESLGQARPAKP